MIANYDTTHGYFPVDDQVLATGFYLTGAGRERIGPHQHYPLPNHPDMYEFSWNTGRVLPEYQLVHIACGSGEFESRETGPVRIQSGMAMILMPDVWHRYRPDSKTGWEEYWISFNGQLPHLWQQAGVITPATAVWRVRRSKPMVKQLEHIVRIAAERSRDGLSPSFSALAILAGLFGQSTQAGPITENGVEQSSQAPRSNDAPRPNDPVVQAALGIIWNYSHRNLSVSQIAERIGVTRRKLERHFAAARNSSVLEELTTCRLLRAQRMLRETHLPIKYIARAAGFTSPEYMATVFGRQLHTTPRLCRAGTEVGR